MIVVDASAWVELMTTSPAPELIQAMGSSGHWVVPEHFRIEALNAVRGLWIGRSVSTEQFAELCEALMSTDFDVWPSVGLIPRAAELAANASAYDAAYIALAEELGCSLVTRDARLARVPGVRCPIVGFAPAA
jgi:predicted nucleic acid-binding protein